MESLFAAFAEILLLSTAEDLVDVHLLLMTVLLVAKKDDAAPEIAAFLLGPPNSGVLSLGC
jgi:hypothetical protein